MCGCMMRACCLQRVLQNYMSRNGISCYSSYSTAARMSLVTLTEETTWKNRRPARAIRNQSRDRRVKRGWISTAMPQCTHTVKYRLQFQYQYFSIERAIFTLSGPGDYTQVNGAVTGCGRAVSSVAVFICGPLLPRPVPVPSPPQAPTLPHCLSPPPAPLAPSPLLRSVASQLH